MKRQYVPNFEILLKVDGKNTTGFQSTEYISHGDCWLTYTGNSLIVEIQYKTNKAIEHRFMVYNLDDIKNFRYTYKEKQ